MFVDVLNISKWKRAKSQNGIIRMQIGIMFIECKTNTKRLSLKMIKKFMELMR